MHAIRVAIVDDQAIIRSGLSSFIMSADDLQLVGEAVNGEEAIQLCQLVEPDVLLMDIRMPVMDGILATRIINQRWPNILILILSNFVEKGLAQSALDAGAVGYLLKDITAEELHTTIRKIYTDRHFLIPKSVTSADRAESLKQLENAIIKESVDLSRLASLLRRHLPSILPGCQIEILIFPDRELLTFPSGGLRRLPPEGWKWLNSQASLRVVQALSSSPWNESSHPEADIILAPVARDLDKSPLGGLAIWLEDSLEEPGCLYPIVETLANHLALGIAQARNEPVLPTRHDVFQELAAAARIQSDLLPAHMPKLEGWDFAARLESARDTSGDFYDIIPLANNHWGVVIADVSDKGMGAALFMAMSSTLIRTYATQYPTLPALTISTVNERILNDTRSDMFVTAFYGVLEPNTGRLRYVNAGHNPPLLVSNQKGKTIDRLRATGMALGVMGDMIWKQKVTRLLPGDVLVLYTDGLTDAQNLFGEFYDERRLLSLIRKSWHSSRDILSAILKDLDSFAGGNQRLDDITLVVIRRQG